ncbi:hypothetical protein Cgig2_012046 [Carnegiea gigantea]|uniref:Uncharacterized protein n=1 Tax=Carnegiea gigantea TaxID=171969 RepID=A0A9Q1KNP6_9CARY|nr:hypothetical protein Cgig2_012046 [Carnegiea gigantea]
MFIQKHNTSNAWRGILDNAGAMRRGVRMEIGNGHNTLFWHHAWVSNTLLCQFSIQPISQHFIDSAVDEFWDYDKGWKWEEFMELITDEATLLLQLHGGCGDGITLDALKIVSMFLINQVTLILKAFDTGCTPTGKAKLRKEMLVRWESPDFGWLKLNIDVLAKVNLGLACGGRLLLNSSAT